MDNLTAFWIGCLAGHLLQPEAIADRLGRPLADVVAAMDGYTVPVVPAGHEVLTILLAAKTRTPMAREAHRRGLYMPDLASLTLATVARDNLFEAVL